jgi:phage-related protein
MHLDFASLINALIPVVSVLATLVIKEIRSHQKDNVHAATMGKMLDVVQSVTPVASVALNVAETLNPKIKAAVQAASPIATPIMQAIRADKQAALDAAKDLNAAAAALPQTEGIAPAADVETSGITG